MAPSAATATISLTANLFTCSPYSGTPTDVFVDNKAVGSIFFVEGHNLWSREFPVGSHTVAVRNGHGTWYGPQEIDLTTRGYAATVTCPR